MQHRADIVTYAIVTAVSVLVWYWAAGETRESRTLPAVRVDFTVPDPTGWRVDPATVTVQLDVVGSQRAIDRAGLVKRLSIELPAAVGRQTIDLADALDGRPEFARTGISVASASPDTVELLIDEIVRVPVGVRPVLPGIQTDGEVTVEPAQVTLSLPGQLRPFVTEDVTVEAFVDRRELDRLEPGKAHRLEHVVLRLPETLADRPVTITPPSVRMSFTIRSQLRELTLEAPVRVQIAGPPEDTEYLVAFDPKQLRDVTVSAPVDVIERIESGAAVVLAVVHLKSSEKEARVTRKRVASFVALLPDGTFVPVDASVGEDRESHPEIGVEVTERERE